MWGRELNGEPQPSAEAVGRIKVVETKLTQGKERLEPFKKALERIRPLWVACHERTTPPSSLAGTLKIDAQVDRYGNIDLAAVSESSFSDPSFSTCIVHRLRAIELPRPTGAYAVSISLRITGK